MRANAGQSGYLTTVRAAVWEGEDPTYERTSNYTPDADTTLRPERLTLALRQLLFFPVHDQRFPGHADNAARVARQFQFW